MMRAGVLWERTTPGLRINGSGSGSWPTPTANEDAAGRPGANMQAMLGNHPDIRGDCSGGSLNPTWTEWLMGWPLQWTSLDPMPLALWVAWQEAFRTKEND